MNYIGYNSIGEPPQPYTTESYLRTITFLGICLSLGGFMDDTYYSKLISYNGYGYDWADKFIIYFYHYSFGLVFGFYKSMFLWITSIQLTPFPNLNNFMDLIVCLLICYLSVLSIEKLRERFFLLRRNILTLMITYPLSLYLILKFIAFLFMK